MATLAQLAEEDRASRSTIPDVPSSPDVHAPSVEIRLPSQVETMPIAVPRPIFASVTEKPKSKAPLFVAVAVVALLVVGALAVFAK